MKTLLMMLTMVGSFATTALHAQNGKSKPDTAILNFISKASFGGMKEIKAGKLAVQKAKSPSVKAFGARMIKDHTTANTKLMSLVRSKGWHITPPSASATHADAMLTGKTGTAFDKAYISMMVQDHQKTVALFENAANNVHDAQISAFAKQTLPIIQQHLAAIQGIATKMNISAAPLAQ